MAFERTLWERLAQAPTEPERTLHIQTDQAVDSVLGHLRRMFNVRQGSVPAAPTYGLPDFNDLVFQFPDAIVQIQRAIRICIEQYEPRLHNVRVHYVEDKDDPLHLRFEIRAELVVETERAPVYFETALDASGRASVRR
jgi:type VI secretion system protein